MGFLNPITIPIAWLHKSRGTAEEKLLVDFGDLIVPESLHVQDVRSKNLGGDTSGKIFECLTTKTTVKGHVVAMTLCVGFFQQREPCFLLILVFGEEKSLGARLVCISIHGFVVVAFDPGKEMSMQ